VPLVLLRSPTPATLPFATTAVLVDVTPVAHLALRARVPPLGRIHQAAPAALVALSLLRLLLSTPTGVTKASTTNTTFSPPFFRATRNSVPQWEFDLGFGWVVAAAVGWVGVWGFWAGPGLVWMGCGVFAAALLWGGRLLAAGHQSSSAVSRCW
jgi:hypothetical protein